MFAISMQIDVVSVCAIVGLAIDVAQLVLSVLQYIKKQTFLHIGHLNCNRCPVLYHADLHGNSVFRKLYIVVLIVTDITGIICHYLSFFLVRSFLFFISPLTGFTLPLVMCVSTSLFFCCQKNNPFCKCYIFLTISFLSHDIYLVFMSLSYDWAVFYLAWDYL